MNSVSITGRVAQEGEVIDFGQAKICNIAIAVNRYKGKDESGKSLFDTSFFDVTAFGKTAEIMAKHCNKGRVIGIEGELKQEKWVDKASGQNRSRVKIIAHSVDLIGRKGIDDEGEQQQEQSDGESPEL